MKAQNKFWRMVRIVRRDPEIHSWWTAQGFRRIPNFDGVSYRTREGTFKLKVAAVDAETGGRSASPPAALYMCYGGRERTHRRATGVSSGSVC